MYLNEYPDKLKVERTDRTVDDTVYPPKETVKTTEHDVEGFMDTPSTNQQSNYHNMEITLDRVLFIPKGTDIKRSDVFFYGDTKYGFVGDLQEEGGSQGNVLSAPVQRV